MFSGDNIFLMAAVVFGGAIFAFWAEKQRWGRQASPLLDQLASRVGAPPGLRALAEGARR